MKKKKIRIGMTKEEIFKILGVPDHRESGTDILGEAQFTASNESMMKLSLTEFFGWTLPEGVFFLKFEYGHLVKVIEAPQHSVETISTSELSKPAKIGLFLLAKEPKERLSFYDKIIKDLNLQFRKDALIFLNIDETDAIDTSDESLIAYFTGRIMCICKEKKINYKKLDINNSRLKKFKTHLNKSDDWNAGVVFMVPEKMSFKKLLLEKLESLKMKRRP